MAPTPLRRLPAPGSGLLGLLGCLLGSFLPGSVPASVIHVPANQPTIQAAIDAAALYGDEIVLADGTYTGAGNRDLVLTKHLTLRSASRDPALCVIDCERAGRGIAISGVVSVARIEGITIRNGLADEGGGIRCDSASPTLVNLRLVANKASVTGGGGIACVNGSAPALRGCLLAGNIASGYDGGGGIYNVGGQPTFVNCSLSGNTTSGVGVIGGALRNKSGGSATFTNCTFSANNAYDATVSYSDGTGTVTTLVNSIVWGHGPGTSGVRIQTHANAATVITYSCVQQGFAGTGNIAANPGLIDAAGLDNVAGTADDDVRIGRFSPCADAGNNAAAGLAGILLDQAGSPRKADDAGVPDTGSGAAPIVDMGAFERQTASVAMRIDVPGDAPTIQTGIDLAQLGDEVVIGDGTWSGPGNVNLVLDKDITVRSASGNSSACVIDGGAGERVLSFSGTTGGALVDGIGIANGRKPEGAGLYFGGSGGIVRNCRIAGNVATGSGGGGVYAEQGAAPEFWNCVFSGNGTYGVGVVGGALYLKGGSTVTFRNCLFTGNTAYDASVLYSDGTGTGTVIVNSIVWGNTGGTSGIRLQNQGASTLSVTYSNVEAGFAGTGNTNMNPIFMDADYRLAPISPCVDTGSNAAVPAAMKADHDGHKRIWDGNSDASAVVDMGPFESGAPQTVGLGDRPVPSGFRVAAVSPNPMRTRGRVAFEIPEAGPVSLGLYDVSGRRVRTLAETILAGGPQEMTWDGRDDAGRIVAPGLYFVRLGWGGFLDTRKVLVVR